MQGSAELLAKSDVLVHPAEPGELSGTVVYGHACCEQYHLVPVFVLVAVHQRRAALATFHHPREDRDDALGLLGRHEVERRAADHLLGCVAYDLLHLPACRGVVALGVDLPDPVPGGQHQVLEARLALAQGLLLGETQGYVPGRRVDHVNARAGEPLHRPVGAIACPEAADELDGRSRVSQVGERRRSRGPIFRVYQVEERHAFKLLRVVAEHLVPLRIQPMEMACEVDHAEQLERGGEEVVKLVGPKGDSHRQGKGGGDGFRQPGVGLVERVGAAAADHDEPAQDAAALHERDDHQARAFLGAQPRRPFFREGIRPRVLDDQAEVSAAQRLEPTAGIAQLPGEETLGFRSKVRNGHGQMAPLHAFPQKQHGDQLGFEELGGLLGYAHECGEWVSCMGHRSRYAVQPVHLRPPFRRIMSAVVGVCGSRRVLHPPMIRSRPPMTFVQV